MKDVHRLRDDGAPRFYIDRRHVALKNTTFGDGIYAQRPFHDTPLR
jgi:hypothetical protein